MNPYRNDSPRRRRRLALFSAATLVSLVALVVVLTLVFVAKQSVNSPGKSSNTSLPAAIAITPAPPPGLPPPTATTLPPIGKNFVLQPHALTDGTPCPGFTLPANVLGLPPATRPTVTPTTAPLPPVPNCGNGKLFAPNCYTVLPGGNPSQDAIRAAMFTVSQQRAMPFSLIEAVGWQESGWQENVQACDGGVGVMQLQPETTTWLNNLNQTSYSSYTLDGNINLGVTMLKWLYNYYVPFCNQGLPSGQTCNWDTVWPGATDGATIRMIVLSAYNEGIGNMAHYGIQNWHYVNNVLSFWQQFKASES